jgi:hypothetical protein
MDNINAIEKIGMDLMVEFSHLLYNKEGIRFKGKKLSEMKKYQKTSASVCAMQIREAINPVHKDKWQMVVDYINSIKQ